MGIEGFQEEKVVLMMMIRSTWDRRSFWCGCLFWAVTLEEIEMLGRESGPEAMFCHKRYTNPLMD